VITEENRFSKTCQLRSVKALGKIFTVIVRSEGFMHIATPTAMVHAITEHTNQTFPFEDNPATLFHRAAMRFSLQEDKEVITCGISPV